MKGDFTRDTFRQRKHYSSVRMQQGRVQLDSDWNEQVDIQAHLQRTEAIDVIGRCGVPVHGAGFGTDAAPGFSIGVVPDAPAARTGGLAAGQDLSISPGRIYVDGILCELESTSIPIEIPADILNVDIGNNRIGPENKNKLVQVHVQSIDGLEFKEDQWVEISGEDKTLSKPKLQIDHFIKEKGLLILKDEIPSALLIDKAPKLRRVVTYLKQPDYSPTDPTPGRYLLYLDVWQRHITCLEDQEILEDALGGPDTTTRTKTIWQAKLQKSDPEENCDSFGPCWVPKDATSTGRLAARATQSSGDAKPCELPAQGGYRSLENQLYRVEFHQYENKVPYFKWSRDNGSIVAKWIGAAIWTIREGFIKGVFTLTVSDAGRDGILGFAHGQWVEITDDNQELLGKSGIIAQVVDASGQDLTIDANTIHYPDNISNLDNTKFTNPKIRRWDGFDIVRLPAEDTPSTTKDGWILLGDEGVEIKFDITGTYQTGDYWLIPARAAPRDAESDGVIWPKNDLTGLPLEFRHGIEHHYCPLAICVLKDPEKGEGSGWAEPKNCAPTFLPLTEIKIPDQQPPTQIENVCCTFTVGKDTDLTLEKVLNEKVNNTNSGNICVCLLPGDHIFPQKNPEIKVSGTHLRIVGCGMGANMILEGPLTTNGFASISLKGLEVQAKSLNNYLSFRDCKEIKVDSCHLILNGEPQIGKETNAFSFEGWGYYEGLRPNSRKFFAGYSAKQVPQTAETNEPYLYETSKSKRILDSKRYSLILRDSKDEETITSSAPLQLDEGYQLAIKSVDDVGNKAYLELSKNGQVVDSKVVQPSIDNAKMSDKTYYYKVDLGDTKGIVQIAVHFKNAFRGADTNLATVDGEFQISENLLSVNELPTNPALEITGSKSILIKDNYIEAYANGLPDWLSSFIDSSGFPELRELFQSDSEQFDRQCNKIAIILAQRDVKIRSKSAQNMSAFLKRGRLILKSLSKIQFDDLKEFLKIIASERIDHEALANALKAVREVNLIAVPATAIVLWDNLADTTIENNTITGKLSIYGRFDCGIEIPNIELEKFAARIVGSKEGVKAITFSESGGTLRINNNQLTCLIVGSSLSENMNAILSGKSDEFSNIYRLSFITNNSIKSGVNQFVTKYLIFNFNSLDLPSKSRDGPIISEDAIFVGNRALEGVNIVNISKRPGKSANLVNL